MDCIKNLSKNLENIGILREGSDNINVISSTRTNKIISDELMQFSQAK